ncbi:MAG: sulfatase-like hydrolase/transferase, partial [Verrucomicrobiota bacterium]
TQFYNTARCWPTRGALLTGYYAQQIRRDSVPGVPSGGGNRGIRPDWAELLSELLEPVGYRSYHTGKWHIDGMPLENGFDHSYYLKDQGRFFNPEVLWIDDVKQPKVEKGTDYYATTALADHAIGVLEDHRENHGDAPFFHYLAFAAPHFPLHALPEDIAVYEETYDVGWDVIRRQRWQAMSKMGLFDPATISLPSRVERDVGAPYFFDDAYEILGEGEVNHPVPWNSLTETQKEFQSRKMAIHAAMIHRMDIEIGRVFEQIKSMGEWENTIVMFLSDNGASAEIMVRSDGHDPEAPMGSAASYLCLGAGWSTVCNTPFRRHKTWTHEGGIATPFVVSWPEGIPARGEIRRNPGHVIDVVPTLLELTGASWHVDAPPSPGKSMVPLFEADGTVEHEYLWWFHDRHKAIRMGDWKAVAPIGEPWELYDLSKDRAETRDLAIVESTRLNRLTSFWGNILDEHAETASADLDPSELHSVDPAQSSAMFEAQTMGKPMRTQELLGGESLFVAGRHAFLMTPKEEVLGESKPWIFYGPALKNTPDEAESWMHEQFLAAGIAVAGIDVGEAYGSPHAFPFFEALYEMMEKLGYSKKPALLGRSRGGLWTSSWAIAHPERVAGLGGIYPVYDFTTFPGLEKAAPVYGMTSGELGEKLDVFNPIRKAGVLARAGIPVHIIHGTDDKIVPLAENSGALERVYVENGAGGLITLVRAEGQKHSFWEGFFTHQLLVDFLIARARRGSIEQ